MRKLIALLFFSLVFTCHAQWDENAGLIPSLLENSVISASSGGNLLFVVDRNMDNYWESANPLPVNYLSDRTLNIFKKQDLYSVLPAGTSFALAVDGNTDTKSAITVNNLSFEFTTPETVKWLHLKINTRDPVTITITKASLQQQQVLYLASENYEFKSVEVNPDDPVTAIALSCSSPYDLFEIAMIGAHPVEYIRFDMGKIQKVGWISTRHYNGEGVKSIRLLGSVDEHNWIDISELQPQATAFIPVIIKPEISVRYLKLEFVLQPRPYQKARLMEIAAYDKNGPYGPAPVAKPATKTYGESMGINAFWGWGYSVYSNLLQEGQGPTLFNQVADLARNYHRIDWDIDRPQQATDFDRIPKNESKSGSHWMHWDREYANWKKAGFTIDASITFDKTTFSDKAWQNTEKEAYDYGNAFAKHFVVGNKFISAIEIGNEPWEYHSDIYIKILKGMSSGIKAASASVVVLPCAVQAFDPALSLNNYISGYLNSTNASSVDGLNTHIYPYIFVEDGKRRATNPEDPRSEVWSLNNLSRFRDRNMSGKILEITEFGYDSEGGGEDCTHDECVSELEQALYGTRMALIFYRLGADAFYWYYFANVDYTSQMHNRSGLTASYSGGFKPKLAFYAFKNLKEQIGSLYFNRIIIENDQAYVYAFADDQGKIKKLIAWRPTAVDHSKTVWEDIPFKTANIGAEFLVPSAGKSNPVPSYTLQTNTIRMALSGNPVVISVKD